VKKALSPQAVPPDAASDPGGMELSGELEQAENASEPITQAHLMSPRPVEAPEPSLLTTGRLGKKLSKKRSAAECRAARPFSRRASGI
jgi:hypothetical protein